MKVLCSLQKTQIRYFCTLNQTNYNYEQIADLPNSYILADDMEFPYGHKLPLWMIGFLY